jgi:hypothetical protein
MGPDQVERPPAQGRTLGVPVLAKSCADKQAVHMCLVMERENVCVRKEVADVPLV